MGALQTTADDLSPGPRRERLLDRGYATHLNAKNPFTGTRISEPGRVVFLEASYQF